MIITGLINLIISPSTIKSSFVGTGVASLGKKIGRQQGKHGNQTVCHGYIKVSAGLATLNSNICHENGIYRVQRPATNICYLDAGNRRLAIPTTAGMQNTSLSQIIKIMSRFLRFRSKLTIAGNGTINYFFVDFFGPVIIYPQPAHDPGTETFQHHIMLPHQAKKNLLTQFSFQIQGQRFFIPVNGKKQGTVIVNSGFPGANIITFPRSFKF